MQFKVSYRLMGTHSRSGDSGGMSVGGSVAEIVAPRIGGQVQATGTPRTAAYRNSEVVLHGTAASGAVIFGRIPSVGAVNEDGWQRIAAVLSQHTGVRE